MSDKEMPIELVATKILLVRGRKVMLDKDLAGLYGVDLIFQNGRSSWGGRRHLPYAFTEQGVAMLSSVLKSKRAIWVNIVL